MVGQMISHYKILEKLGEGGMGVVYKAEDTKLDRTVALKFLPGNVAASEQDKARFIQEAKAAAALNHPNVCSIIDIQDHDGQMFIVMEFVDGQTLRDKMGTITLKQAIDIGIQIADGLTAAHEKGIVHRDIKPENIMVRKDGICQIMDFGLAKLRSASSKINRLTKEGSTVGTAGYMSPEQVVGQDVDHRSDIFSLGVVLYEAFTGQLPFKGVHETALAYEIVNVDPAPMSSVKPEIDAALDAIVLDCLEKDPKERCQSVAEVARDLRRIKRESTRQRHSRITAARPAYASSSTMQPPEGSPVYSEKPSGGSRLLPWILTGIFLLAAIGMGYFHFTHQPVPEERRIVRSNILPPNRINFNVQVGGHITISPDGRMVAFVGTDTTGADLVYVRPVESLTPVPLAGTNGATYPFWSYDSKTIGFFAAGKLKKIEATGGPTLTICDASDGRGGTWNQAGIIIFAPTQAAGLSKVSAAGGIPVPVTTIDTAGTVRNHRWPHFLPDGKHFIYTTQSNATGVENDLVRIAELDTQTDTVLMHGNSNVEYASGYLLFHRQSTLMAQPFDTTTMKFTADALPIAEQLQYNPLRSRAMYSVSRTGVLIYQGGEEQQGKLAIFDQSGNRTHLLGMVSPRGGRFSPDGKRVVYGYLDDQNRQSDLWLYEMDGGRSSRFTFEMSLENFATWSPHGDSIVFSSDRLGRSDLYIKSSNGTGTEVLLSRSDLDKQSYDWSLDGRYISYTSFNHPKTKSDLWLLPMTGERKPVLFLQTEFGEQAGAFSPDTKWIAYMSNESGKWEIYVRAFDNTPGKWQISVNGGVLPRWSRDGKHIFFQSIDRKEMSAAVRIAQSSVVVDSVRTLFDYESRGIIGSVTHVSGDGQKFLAIVTELRQASPPITLVVNWNEKLQK